MRLPLLATAALVLAACDEMPSVTRAESANLYTPAREAPADAEPGTCWDKTVTPAVVETVTEEILVEPARMSDTGTVQSPPVYRSESRQVIVTERQARFVQTVCPADLTRDFVSSVQRALALRGLYGGPITGEMDGVTRDALARFQTDAGIAGPDPETLTVEAARRMGLWVVEAAALD